MGDGMSDRSDALSPEEYRALKAAESKPQNGPGTSPRGLSDQPTVVSDPSTWALQPTPEPTKETFRKNSRAPLAEDILTDLGFSLSTHGMSGDQVISWTYAKSVRNRNGDYRSIFANIDKKPDGSFECRLSSLFGLFTITSGTLSWPHPRFEPLFLTRLIDIVTRL